MEQRILADLQQALAEDIAGDETLKDLTEEVEELQTKIVRRASMGSNKYLFLLFLPFFFRLNFFLSFFLFFSFFLSPTVPQEKARKIIPRPDFVFSQH